MRYLQNNAVHYKIINVFSIIDMAPFAFLYSLDLLPNIKCQMLMPLTGVTLFSKHWL